MPTVEEIRGLLSKVTVIDDHATILEEAVNTIEGNEDTSLVDDVLAVFERCDGQDDYGMFSSLLSRPPLQGGLGSAANRRAQGRALKPA